jgi:hypothetical protein
MQTSNNLSKLFILISSWAAISASAVAQERPAVDDIKAIATEAAIYGLPMVMNYGTMYAWAIDKGGAQYKAPFNELVNQARVFTPEDTTVVTPNSDTPYSFAWMDLRAEPVVLCVPEIEKDRYYSIQLISLYTYNFGYIGSRATGNGTGCYAVSGPNWSGEKPTGIAKILQSGTDFALAIYRTQLFDPADLDNVKAIQAKYSAQPLSEFLGQPAPAQPDAIDWPEIDKGTAGNDPFRYLAFLLQFSPATGPAAVEKPLREKFASIGIEPGQAFSTESWSDAEKSALAEGIKAGVANAEERAKSWGEQVNGWRSSKDGFGSRAILGEDYLTRAAAALNGIYGNDAAEALYPLSREDGDDETLDGSKHNYTLTFPKDQLPPVNAFWSVTMYDGKTQLLIENPINRYLINSPMLPDLKRNEDGSLTIYIQNKSPGADKESNWLPAPDGLIYIAMRLYWPKEAALNGNWGPPPIKKAE